MKMSENKLLLEMIEQLDLPKSVEEKVYKRYQSLADWFMREESTLKDVDIFVQGSFGQGTTIKPLEDGDEYDLDMSCKVNIPNFKSEYTQEQLMNMVKYELELYRIKAGIHQEIEGKRRCVRLCYKDEVSFHLDFVPSIPLEEEKNNEYRSILLESYRDDMQLATNLSTHAVNIPDNEKDNYTVISEEWHMSNQRGYLLWFQNRIATKKQGIFEASIEPIPVYHEKSVLQRCIQLLKRHRDTMFADASSKDSKPISIIITTLAARSYEGEENIEEAIMNILSAMEKHISTNIPRISNPVMPEEDFTDRWDNPEFEKLKLEKNFYLWLEQAKTDFNRLVNGRDGKEIRSVLENGFALDFSEKKLQEEYGYRLSMSQVNVVETSSIRPWRR